MTPAERGALEEIAQRIEKNPHVRIEDISGQLSPSTYLLLQAICQPLRERDNKLLQDAEANGALPQQPRGVEVYYDSLSRDYNEHRKVSARLAGNEKKLTEVQARVDRDRAQVEQWRADAWTRYDRLSEEERRWLFPASSRAHSFPPFPRQFTPLTVLTGGAETADVEAIKILLRRLLGEDQR